MEPSQRKTPPNDQRFPQLIPLAHLAETLSSLPGVMSLKSFSSKVRHQTRHHVSFKLRAEMSPVHIKDGVGSNLLTQETNLDSSQSVQQSRKRVPTASIAIRPTFRKIRVRGKVVEQLVSGAFAGIVSRTAVAPLDLIRTHLITAHGSMAAKLNAIQICSAIFERDGWRGLFRGNGINCLRVGPNKAIELFVFENLKRILARPENPFSAFAAPLSGGAAGMAATLATYPLELMRTRISVQPLAYRGIKSTFQKIVREEGLGALYRGLTPSILGVFPYAASNYFVYDALRSAYQKSTGLKNVPPLPTLLFGAMAAAVSSAFTFPLEVARRQLQLGGPLGSRSFADVMVGIYRREGIFAIYRGLGTTWLKLVPAAGISFVCYEAARVALRVEEDTAPAQVNSEVPDVRCNK